MNLPPNVILRIDKARMEGHGIGYIRAAIARAGLDPNAALKEYRRLRLPDGRLRGDVNLSDPHEWGDAPADRRSGSKR